MEGMDGECCIFPKNHKSQGRTIFQSNTHLWERIFLEDSWEEADDSLEAEVHEEVEDFAAAAMEWDIGLGVRVMQFHLHGMVGRRNLNMVSY